MLVETGNLLCDCPIWKFMFGPSVPLCTPFVQRMYAIREKWSHRVVEISAPVNQTPAGLVDGMTYMLWFLEDRCRTTAYWKVIGPAELLVELAYDPGMNLPWPRREWHNLNFYLCQHEIRGD